MSLGKNLKARGSVEKWLGDVESRMVSSLKRLAKTAYQSYTESKRTEWLLRHPGQLVLTISQIRWCEDAERALERSSPEALEEFYKV